MPKPVLASARPLALALLAAGVFLSELPAQVVSPKTVPVRQEDQFDIFPSRLAPMGGVSIALDDTLLDPFVNPAKATRVASGWLQVAPFVHEMSLDRGGGRTVPLSAYVAGGRWSVAGLVALQELDRPTTVFNAPISQRRATNQYASASLGVRLTPTLSAGLSAYSADLNALDQVDLLYAGSDRIVQSGRQSDLRAGLVQEWAGGRTGELLVLHSRYRMTHDVHYPEQWRWPPCCGQTVPPNIIPARDEHNVDRSNISGVHAEYSHPFGANGWRAGWLVTANRQTHPKIPNYQIMNIPRDPGRSDGFNLGVGLGRTRGGTTVGVDVVVEPIRSRTWAEAAADTQSVNDVPIPRGAHTVDNRFRFSNAILRAGFGHDVPVVADSSATLGFQVGLGIRSIRYTLEQDDHIQATTRSQSENWIEWRPTLGVRYRGRDLEVSYAFSRTCGPECGDDRDAIVFPPPVPAGEPGGGVPLVVAPAGPLDFQGGTVTRHRIMFSFRLR